MKVSKYKPYTILKPDTKNVNKEGISFLFFKEFIDNYTNFKDENLILDFSDNPNIGLKEILLFSQICDKHKKNGKSFVFLSKVEQIDDFPNNIIAVRTQQEAEDVIELEEIERDLGI